MLPPYFYSSHIIHSILDSKELQKELGSEANIVSISSIEGRALTYSVSAIVQGQPCYITLQLQAIKNETGLLGTPVFYTIHITKKQCSSQ
jgi:hypothetical protein